MCLFLIPLKFGITNMSFDKTKKLEQINYEISDISNILVFLFFVDTC